MVIAEPLDSVHRKYPTAYWGQLNGVGAKAGTIRLERGGLETARACATPRCWVRGCVRGSTVSSSDASPDVNFVESPQAQIRHFARRVREPSLAWFDSWTLISNVL